MKIKGLIHIYTGEGKGKTTAAVGLAVRARGHDFRVGYISFCKNPEKWECGERKPLKKLGVDVFGFAKEHPCFSKEIKPDDMRCQCLDGIEFIKKIFQENKYDVLILDEIDICLRDGFLKEEEILEILNLKPENLELILTGRGVTKKIIEKADLVSEIKKIKHPYDSGIQGRKGIEY